MTVDVLPASARLLASGELPAGVGNWSLTRITAGVFLSASGRDAPANVRALMAEPGRLAVVVDAGHPDPRTDELVSELFPVLASAGWHSLRLVLSRAADRYAAVARTHGIDLIAADADVVITTYGYALVRSHRPVAGGVLPQWRRLVPDGDQPAGVLFPSPAWERHLTDGAALGFGQRVRRVPAGLALRLGSPDSDAGAEAVWPDPERITIVVDNSAPGELARASLAELLPLLPREWTGGVRLHWPRAGAGSAARELASECGTDLIVPAADVSASDGFGGVCHGPAGAAPWLRLASDGTVQVMGSQYPVPAWEAGLADADLSGLAGELNVEHVAAGLCLCRPGPAARALVLTARSMLPESARVTIVVAGDASSSQVRQDVEDVVSRLPAASTASLRLVLAGAGGGGGDSFAQSLADAFGINVVAPAGRWTATPDGRLKAIAPVTGMTDDAASAGAEAGGWREFSPRCPGPDPVVAGSAGPRASFPHQEDAPPDEPARAGGEPDEPVAPDEVPAQDEQPVAQASVVLSSPGAASGITLFARDHRSSEQERMRYRESAARYQTHAVSVRRVLTQRPGLRAAAAGDSDDAVVTDFAAVLDFLGDDVDAATLRTGTGDDPRIACVISGLRRLPSFTGVVYSSANRPSGAAGGYVTGMVLIEPAFVYASSSGRVAPEGDTQYVIWSQTGKRVAALAADARPDEIIFAAGTEYKVLQVVATSRSGQTTVFLRESPRRRDGRAIVLAAGQPGQPAPERTAEPFDDMDATVLERLAAAAALRDETTPDLMARRGAYGAAPIGLDPSGVPFPVQTAAG